MPTYYRPKVAHVEPGGAGIGGLVLLAAGIAAASAVVAFILAHLIVIAVAVGVLAAVPLGSVLMLRRFIQPRGIRRWHREQRAALARARVPISTPVQGLPTARPRAIEAPRAVPAQVRLRDTFGAR